MNKEKNIGSFIENRHEITIGIPLLHNMGNIKFFSS